jgi:YfiR/HmsC-like
VAAAVLSILAAAMLPALAGAQQQVYSAERVKAAFLYHFSTYVNWPTTAEPGDTFSIAVLGADQVAAELEQFLPGHTIQGRPMQVHRLRSLTELAGDEVLYIGTDDDRELREQLAAVASRPMLVVTDAPDGLRDGAMINFRIVDDRVRFEISQRAAQDAGLEMSSRLLSAAMSVESAGAIVDFDNTMVATDHRNQLGR